MRSNPLGFRVNTQTDGHGQVNGEEYSPESSAFSGPITHGLFTQRPHLDHGMRQGVGAAMVMPSSQAVSTTTVVVRCQQGLLLQLGLQPGKVSQRGWKSASKATSAAPQQIKAEHTMSLQAAAPLQTQHEDYSVVEWAGQTSENTFHIFINATQSVLDLFYFFSAEGGQTKEIKYGSIQPGSNLYVGRPS